MAFNYIDDYVQNKYSGTGSNVKDTISNFKYESPKLELPKIQAYNPPALAFKYEPPKIDMQKLPAYNSIKPPRLQNMPGLTDYGRQEMYRMAHNLPPGLTPYAMQLPGMRPL